jgi:Papain family cysteine protease
MNKKIIIYIILLWAIKIQAQDERSFGIAFDEVSYKKLPQIALPTGEKGDNIPKMVTLRPFCPMPGQQGKVSACTGYATGYGAMTIAGAVKRRLNTPAAIRDATFSAAYVYNSVKQKKDDCSEGIVVERALQFLKEKGNCRYSDFDTVQRCAVLPDTVLVKIARKNRIRDFAPVLPFDSKPPLVVSTLKTYLRDSVPVMVVIKVNPSLAYLKKGSKIWQKRVNEASLGLHALVVTGYDEDKRLFEVMSSWGTDWGDNGFAYIDYGDMGSICLAAYVLFVSGQTPQQLPVKNQKTAIAPGIPTLGVSMLKGKLNFVRVAEVDTGYVFVQEPAQFDDLKGVYRLATGSVPTGTQYQLTSSGTTSGAYLYMFSCDASGKVELHYPKPFFSALVPGPSAQIVVPSSQSVLRLTQPGQDFIVAMYSDQPFDNIRERFYVLTNYNQDNFMIKLRQAFPELVPTQTIQHLKEMTTEGKFDPSRHNAIATVLMLRTKD